MNELINGDILKPISDLGIALLDKIEKSTGWIFSTTTAQKGAYKNIIEEISKRKDINPIDRAIIISNFNKIKRQHKNRAKIIEKAIGLLEEGDTPQTINDDWLLSFFDFCKNVSTDELQYIWAKILANECKKENSSTLNLLRILSDISSNEIEIFIHVLKECNYGMRCFDAIGIVSIDSKYLEKINIKFDDIIKLEDIGIMNRETISLDDEIVFELDNKTIKFVKKEDKKGKIIKLQTFATFYRLTNIGMKLAELTDIESNQDPFIALENALKDYYDMIIIEN